MKKAQLIVAGIGPGSPEDITPAVIQAVKNSDVVSAINTISSLSNPIWNRAPNV